MATLIIVLLILILMSDIQSGIISLLFKRSVYNISLCVKFYLIRLNKFFLFKILETNDIFFLHVTIVTQELLAAILIK